MAFVSIIQWLGESLWWDRLDQLEDCVNGVTEEDVKTDGGTLLTPIKLGYTIGWCNNEHNYIKNSNRK